uniref:GCS light chain n=1 Tax=Parascaris univalens TaxID=6257 RepID=A0A915C4C4_PARUN
MMRIETLIQQTSPLSQKRIRKLPHLHRAISLQTSKSNHTCLIISPILNEAFNSDAHYSFANSKYVLCPIQVMPVCRLLALANPTTIHLIQARIEEQIIMVISFLPDRIVPNQVLMQ